MEATYRGGGVSMMSMPPTLDLPRWLWPSQWTSLASLIERFVLIVASYIYGSADHLAEHQVHSLLQLKQMPTQELSPRTDSGGLQLVWPSLLSGKQGRCAEECGASSVAGE